jgi:dihydrofolate reductase
MVISLIAAMSKNRVIGSKGSIPWTLPADMKRLKEITMGKPIIMGRKTHESIGKPLPGRINIVVTKDTDYKSEGCIVVHSADEAVQSSKDYKEIIIFGGQKIYEMFMDKVDKMYLTIVDAKLEGDTFFPEYDAEEWKETHFEDHAKDSINQYDYRFITLERKQH